MNGDFQQRVRRSAMYWLYGFGASVGCVLVLRATTSVEPEVELWVFAGLVLVATGIVFASARALAAREEDAIRLMTTAAHDLAAGHFERTIPGDQIQLLELRQLGEAINSLATRVQRDIADMKRLERMRSEFLGNVSHELRTPIFSVQGYLETLIDGAVDDPSVRDDFLRKAHLNVLRLHNLLTDLIEISRIESGEMKMSFRYFDAVEYFNSIIDELQPTAEMAGVSLTLRVVGEATDHTAFGDRERLKQAVVNLVENAIKYNRPNGSVTIELDFHESELIVNVIDTGIGIPEADQGRIFERFYRVDKNRSRAVGGSGLGLAIVKHIIEAHRSSVRVRSVPGVGSTFSFGLRR